MFQRLQDMLLFVDICLVENQGNPATPHIHDLNIRPHLEQNSQTGRTARIKCIKSTSAQLY